MAHGVFIGMATLDIIYYSAKLPGKNEKIMAGRQSLAPGGPACNAARTFCSLGNTASLHASLGAHPASFIIKKQLEKWQITVTDITPNLSSPPPIASIIVDPSNGDRSVLSVPSSDAETASKWDGHMDISPDILLADGHQIPRAIELATQFGRAPLVLDGGSWKPGFKKLLPLAKFIVCSADFFPPQCTNERDVFEFLKAKGIQSIAVTHGADPISYLHDGNAGQVSPPKVRVEDTTGAGDIFHGAFCHYVLTMDFAESLRRAAKVASRSCEFCGTDPPQ